MSELEKVMQEEMFDIEAQYCDPDNCVRDCYHTNGNYCDVYINRFW